MTTKLAALLDAQARVDDGTATKPDHDCAERLELLLQAGAERVLRITTVADLDAAHDAICDTRDKTCHHYESPEEG